MSTVPTPPAIRKLSQSEYLDIRSGEVCEFSQSDNRSDNTDSLRKTFRKVRDLINCNCTDFNRLHWVTLTYADNMTDSARLYTDFKKFVMRLKYYCTNELHRTPPEYIAVAEPQGRGAWHMHLLLIWDSKRPYIANNSVFAPLWGHGYTKIQSAPKDCDNLGAYLSAYLGDIPLSELPDTSGISQDNIKTVGKKKIVKGGRLHLYPVGMNIIRTSRGIARPTTTTVDHDDIEKEKASAGTLTYRAVYALESDDGSQIYVSNEYYNTNRRHSQARLAEDNTPTK